MPVVEPAFAKTTGRIPPVASFQMYAPYFSWKPARADLLENAQALEDRQAAGQERLADVEARELLPLEDDDPAAGAREQRSRRVEPAGPPPMTTAS